MAKPKTPSLLEFAKASLKSGDLLPYQKVYLEALEKRPLRYANAHVSAGKSWVVRGVCREEAPLKGRDAYLVIVDDLFEDAPNAQLTPKTAS